MKKVTKSSRVCMTHSEEPRVAESGLRLPNETDLCDYLFGDFMARNTPYCVCVYQNSVRVQPLLQTRLKVFEQRVQTRRLGRG